MDARRMCESVTPHDGFIGLHRHIHECGNQAACRVYFSGVDIGIESEVFVALERHYHFFERRVSGTFANPVDGNFHLTRSVKYARKRVGGSHSQILMAVRGKDGAFHIYVIHQIFDLCTINVRKTVTGCIGDVNHGCSGIYNSLHHARKIFVIGAAGVFGVKFHVVHKPAGIFHGFHGTLDNFFAVGVEFVFDVYIGCADSGVDAFAFGVFERFGSHFDVFFHGTGERAYYRPGNGFRDFDYRVEIARAGNRKTGFYNIYSQQFQGFGHLNFFDGV